MILTPAPTMALVLMCAAPLLRPSTPCLVVNLLVQLLNPSDDLRELWFQPRGRLADTRGGRHAKLQPRPTGLRAGAQGSGLRYHRRHRCNHTHNRNA